jgi:hypothetical protein
MLERDTKNSRTWLGGWQRSRSPRVIKDPIAIKYANEEFPDVSAGYDAGYLQEKNGEANQYSILIYHGAMLKHGRAGSRVAIKDSITQGTPSMTRDENIIALGEVYTGEDLKPRIDRAVQKLQKLILVFEPLGKVFDPGMTWTGDVKQHYKRVADALQALERAIDDASKEATATCDAAKRVPNPCGRVVTPAQANKDALDFYSPNRARVTPAKGPITPAELNRQSEEFYGKGAA